MKSFVEFINENSCNSLRGIINEAFTIYYDNEEENKKEFNNRINPKNNDKVSVIINNLFNLVYAYAKEYDIKYPFTYDNKSNKIKLNRLYGNTDDSDFANDFLKKLNKIDGITDIKANDAFKLNGKKIDFGDGGLSPRAKSGINTEPQESAFCDTINTDKSINNIIKDRKLDDSYVFSLTSQFNKIKKYLNNDIKKYVCVRPSNKKDEIIQLLDKIYSIKKIFNGLRTSYITPADVYIYNKDQKDDIKKQLIEFLEYTNKEHDKLILFNVCKKMFVDFLENKTLLGISLKKIVKVSSNNKIEILNIDNYNISLEQNFNITISSKGMAAYFKIKNSDNTIKFNYRSAHSGLEPLIFEFNTLKSGGAEGKFKEFVKAFIQEDKKTSFKLIEPKMVDLNKLDIISEYNKLIKDLDKFKEFKNPDYDDNKLKEINNSKQEKYILFAVLNFIKYLFELYNRDNNHKEFFDFIEDCYLSSKKITKYSLPYIKIY